MTEFKSQEPDEVMKITPQAPAAQVILMHSHYESMVDDGSNGRDKLMANDGSDNDRTARYDRRIRKNE